MNDSVYRIVTGTGGAAVLSDAGFPLEKARQELADACLGFEKSLRYAGMDGIFAGRDIRTPAEGKVYGKD